MKEMEASSVNNVCRLCPESGSNQKLLDIFDPKLSQSNMKEVIFQTTGVKVRRSCFYYIQGVNKKSGRALSKTYVLLGYNLLEFSPC